MFARWSCRTPEVFFALALAMLSCRSAWPADVVIYSDGLNSGWENWSWDTTVDLSSTSPVQSGSHALSATYTSAWAGLYLHSNTALTAQDYATLQFWIHGGSAGGQNMRVAVIDASLNPSPNTHEIPLPQANEWTSTSIPLATFGALTDISGIWWQDSSGGPQPAFHLDGVVLMAKDGPQLPGPSLTVDVLANRHPISPHIYGLNFGDEALIAELRVPVRRWGGNATTRYNWQNDTANHASDWFFENIPNSNPDPGRLPFGSASDRFVERNSLSGAKTILTLPLIGWTPAQRAYACGFSVAKYGPQQSTDPWRPDCGNGIRPDGTKIAGNDPSDTSAPIDPAFVQGWLQHLIGQFGTAGSGGVQFYCFDNEPMLWNETHRDVHPADVGYDEISSRTIAYAAAIKQADPAAMTLGPVLWGWSAYFYSAKDREDGGAWWDTRSDRRAHGDVPFIEWYLQQMKQYEDNQGVRLLNYLDLHYYPQSNVALQPAGDLATQARRLRSTRSLWDATYVDESWIAEPVRLIPRMRDWINTHYPGTKLAITEYNFGGLEHINGAVAQADVLGILGREGVDLAALWDPPEPDEPGAYALRMYLDYDGAHRGFGNISVRAESTDQARLSVYAAQRNTDFALTIVVVNKAFETLDASLQIQGVASASAAEVYRYSNADLTRIVRESDQPVSENLIAASFPAQSITLFVVPAQPSEVGQWTQY